jgi:hypothetical protein
VCNKASGQDVQARQGVWPLQVVIFAYLPASDPVPILAAFPVHQGVLLPSRAITVRSESEVQHELFTKGGISFCT